MHLNGKNSCLAGRLCALSLAIAALLGGCQKAPQADRPGADPPPAAGGACGDDGYLSTALYGNIEREIHWSATELHCESMLRPQGKGVRLRFTGEAADSQLAIILALPELQRGVATVESPTVVTLTVEGSGRFFSTPTSEFCWSDIAVQEPIAHDSDRYDISGTLYCVAPLGEINGDAAISVPELRFRGIVDWSST